MYNIKTTIGTAPRKLLTTEYIEVSYDAELNSKYNYITIFKNVTTTTEQPGLVYEVDQQELESLLSLSFILHQGQTYVFEFTNQDVILEDNSDTAKFCLRLPEEIIKLLAKNTLDNLILFEVAKKYKDSTEAVIEQQPGILLTTSNNWYFDSLVNN